MKAGPPTGEVPFKILYNIITMPRKPSKSKAGKGKAKRQYKKRSTKKSGNVPDMAYLSCKRTLTGNGASGNFNVNTLYNLMNTQLIDYAPRATYLAKVYQFYKIKNIKLTFKPTYDTFASGGQSKMNIYYMLDKSGSVPTNTTLEGLKQMGARPKQLDEKNFIVSWTPTVLESSMYAPPVASSPSKYLTAPWLSTNANIISPGAPVPSGVDHLGVYWFVEQLVTGGQTTEYQLEVEVQLQFKKAQVDSIASSVSAIPASISILNDSPDGVVGGVDGV